MTKHGTPCAQVLSGLGSACSSSAAPAALRTAVQRQVVIGLFRDLRGVTMATNSRRTYGPPRSCACAFLVCMAVIRVHFWSELAACSRRARQCMTWAHQPPRESQYLRINICIAILRPKGKPQQILVF